MGTSPGFVTGQVPSATQWNGYFANKADDFPMQYVQPTTGLTLTAIAGSGGFIIDPAGELATLIVVPPPGARDQQIFRINTSMVIDAITILPNVGQNLNGGGPFVFSANGGMAWQFVAAIGTWFKVQ